MKGNRQKEYTPNDSIYVELEEMQIICSDRKQISTVGVQRGEREREVADGQEETLGATDVFTILIAMVVPQVCAYIKTSPTVYYKHIQGLSWWSSG